MSTNHESLARRWWEEVWNRGRLETIEELTSPDCVLHADGVVFRGPAEIRQRTEAIRAAFRDIELHVEQLTVHGDWVISRWQSIQTHTGDLNGLPPTHERVVVNGSTWMRVENGRLVEGWDFWQQEQGPESG